MTQASQRERSMRRRLAAIPPRAHRPMPFYAHPFELLNSLTHALGTMLSMLGAVLIVEAARATGDPWRIASVAIYAASLVGVYLFSTLSHLVHHGGWRRRFRALDQGCIYFLIAGTYTPFGLVFLRSGPWSLILLVMWAVALPAFVAKVWFSHRLETVSVLACVLLGWLPLLAAIPLTGVVPIGCLWMMLAGGLAYTIGTLFLMFDERNWYFHATWHAFVIAGSTLHFLAIWKYVVLGVAP